MRTITFNNVAFVELKDLLKVHSVEVFGSMWTVVPHFNPAKKERLPLTYGIFNNEIRLFDQALQPTEVEQLRIIYQETPAIDDKVVYAYIFNGECKQVLISKHFADYVTNLEKGTK